MAQDGGHGTRQRWHGLALRAHARAQARRERMAREAEGRGLAWQPGIRTAAQVAALALAMAAAAGAAWHVSQAAGDAAAEAVHAQACEHAPSGCAPEDVPGEGAAMALATAASMATGSTCAAIGNVANVAAWRGPGQAAEGTTYRDEGDRIRYWHAPGAAEGDRAAWRALHAAERALADGPRGPRLAVACSR